MRESKKLTAKDVALTTCFTALYTYFCFIPTFQIVGLLGKAITLAAIMAPIIGMILGPYLGMLSTILGGIIGLFFAVPFTPPSFVSGIVTAFFAGMLYMDKRSIYAFTYFSLLFFFGFYPFVGPVWVYPLFMWFQIIGFLVLVSPLQSIALKNIRNSNNDSRLLFSFFIVSLISTLAGQIAGSLAYEAQYLWPISLVDVNLWKPSLPLLTWVYPWERIIIALAAAFIGVALHKVLKSANLMPWFNAQNRRQC